MYGYAGQIKDFDNLRSGQGVPRADDEILLNIKKELVELIGMYGARNLNRADSYAKEIIKQGVTLNEIRRMCSIIRDTCQFFPSFSEFKQIYLSTFQIRDKAIYKKQLVVDKEFQKEEKHFDKNWKDACSLLGEDNLLKYVALWHQNVFGDIGNLADYGFTYKLFAKPALNDLIEAGMKSGLAIEIGKRKINKGKEYGKQF